MPRRPDGDVHEDGVLGDSVLVGVILEDGCEVALDDGVSEDGVLTDGVGCQRPEEVRPGVEVADADPSGRVPNIRLVTFPWS